MQSILRMMKFEMYKGKDNELYFWLIDNAGKILLSSVGYKKKESVLTGIEYVKKNVTSLNAIEKKETPKGQFYFNMKGSGGQIIGTSTMFGTRELRDKWLSILLEEIQQMQIVESTK